MKQYLLTALLIFSVGNLSANDKKVVVKKMVVNTDQEEKNIDVNVEVDDNIMTLAIIQDGEEDVYKVDITDDKALEGLKEELERMDMDVNVMMFMKDGDHDEDMIILDDEHHSFDMHHFKQESGGYLGVQIQDLTDQLRSYFKVKADGGVLITEVVAESPAEKAGLDAGDVITKVNDIFISDTDELTKTIRKEAPDTEAVITVVRMGREKTLSATLGKSEGNFSWFGGLGDHKDLMKHKMFFKKFDHECDDNCKDTCNMKNFDIDIVIPDKKGKKLKKKIKVHGDGLEKTLEELKEELEKLKDEMKELKDS